MPIIASENKTDYTPAPEGLWQGVCCDVIDLGMQTSQWGESHQVEIRWQLGCVGINGKEVENDPKTERPFIVVRRYRLSLHEKSNLRPMLEAWRGRKFNEEELKGFDLEKLVGANCQIQTLHAIKSSGGSFTKVQAVVPLGRGTKKISVREYTRVCDRTQGTEAQPTDDDDEEPPPF